jgi:hypothetical protein
MSQRGALRGGNLKIIKSRSAGYTSSASSSCGSDFTFVFRIADEGVKAAN